MKPMTSIFTQIALLAYRFATRLGITNTRLGRSVFLWSYNLYKSLYEARELHSISVIPQTCIIDVGANVGFFTRYFAQKNPTGLVIAIEPEAKNCETLKAMLKKEQLADRVRVIQAVADAQVGEQHLIIDPFHPANHRIGDAPNTQTVQAITLDSLLETINLPVSLIKIDVQGAELRVLEGAGALLSQQKPVLYIEVSEEALNEFETKSEVLLRYILQYGYSLYHHDRLISLEDALTIVKTSRYTDFLCRAIKKGE